MWKSKGAETMLKKKDKVGEISPPNLNSYQIAEVRKALWYWQRDRYIEQWDRAESPEIKPHRYSQRIFDKGTKQFNEGRIMVFSASGARMIEHPQAKK